MTKEEAITNLNMISVAFVDPVTREQRKLINETFEMAIMSLSQEPCDDAISRDAVKDWFCTNYCSEHNQCEHFEQGDCNAMIELFELPSVTQKSGKWIDINGIYAKCSSCNEEIYITGDFKYCPNCGAKMESEEEK